MKNDGLSLKPPVALAIAYAPQNLRARLTWLLMFDRRLSDVLTRASEPMIAQLRLSWWRDALNAPAFSRPKGEPLLAELNGFEPDEHLAVASLALVDAYEMLATGADSLETEAAHRQRISAITDAFAGWLGRSSEVDAGVVSIASWWLNPTGGVPKSLPRALRPLSIIALAAHLENADHAASPLRLNWHALTGR